MILWVKEYGDKLTLQQVSLLTKKEISVKVLEKVEMITNQDVVVVTNADPSLKSEDFYRYTILVYEEVFQALTENILDELHYHYDYHYLKNALSKSTNSQIDTIITGSSYGLFGIDTAMLERAVNLSLMSQDLYYSLKGIYHVLERNSGIKQIVLCCGYYYFFTDLSKVTNQKELQRITKVYDKLYGDVHNCHLLPPDRRILIQSDIFDVSKLLYLYSVSEYQKGYFYSDGRPRSRFATKEWEDKTKTWEELSDFEKIAAAQRRTEAHNKLKKRVSSLQENKKLLDELSLFCEKRGINLHIVVVPSTKYYQEFLDKEYKDIFYEVLNQAGGVIQVWDLAEEEFPDEKFNDMDHLNELGARVMTELILNITES